MAERSQIEIGFDQDIFAHHNWRQELTRTLVGIAVHAGAKQHLPSES